MNPTNTRTHLGLTASALLLMLAAMPVRAQHTTAPNTLPAHAFAPDALQSWEDRSDELPGMMDGGTLLIAGAVAVGAVVALVAIQRNRKKKRDDEQKNERSQAEDAREENAHSQLLSPARSVPPVALRPTFRGLATPYGVTVGARWRF